MNCQPSTNKSIAKSAALLGSGTLLSRILGFIRDVIIAKLFGTAAPAQAFVVAFRIPNLLRDLVGEGATNAAFVPIFSEYLAIREKEEFWRLANVVLNILMVLLVSITILGIFLSPLIVRIIAPGFIQDSAKLNLTIWLTRIMFPYLLLIGLTAYMIGLLHSLKHFLAPALGPCMLNIAVILCALYLCPWLKVPVLALGIGVLIGGTIQLGIQIPALLRRGARRIRRAGFLHPAAVRIGRLLLPRALGTAVYQINVFVDTILASLAFIVGEGGVAALYYSNRVIQFPLAVFGIALAQAALPTMSTQVAKENLAKLKDTLLFSLRGVFFIMLPASLGLLALARPIIEVLFQRGTFDLYSTSITSQALFFYAFGLCAYGGIKVLVSCFYSLQDTLTPVKVASLSLIVNIVLNLILMWPLKIGGLALATAISATFNFCLLSIMLRKRLGPLYGIKRWLSPFLKILSAAIIMAAACYLSYKWLKPHLCFPLSEWIVLGVVIIFGIIIYLVLCTLFKVEEATKILNLLPPRRWK